MPPLTIAGYALVGLTIMVAILLVVVIVMLVKAASGRGLSRKSESRGESAMLSMALQEAVTKLKAQERATAARAEASERLASQIVEGLTSGLVVVDRAGRVQTINPAAGRILGLDETAVSIPFRDALSKAPALADVIAEALEDSAPILRRTVALGGTSKPSHLGVTVSPLFGAQGQLDGAICLFTDLTAVKDLEEQLLLKDSLATVGELTAGIAHEFRNGLATIHGYSKLFDLNQLPEAYRPYVEGIRAETESLSRVVTNFLNFARPAQLTLTRVNLRAICERAAEEIRPDALALGGDVLVSGEFGAVEGDEVLLRQAFSNLLRNAVEACAGTSVAAAVTLRSEIDPAQKVSRITVNDNGPGIPAASRERVFQPFFTSKRNGTGLGLALVQKIIVFHNGRVVAGTSPAGGASLQVTLPLA